jgi:hypothetical protein
MKDFEKITAVCTRTSRISEGIVDKFLIYYAATRYNLDQELTKSLAPFRHITKQFPQEWENRLKAQYIAHRIFRSGGLINKMFSHSAIKNRTSEELEFLTFQSENPWRFSFSTITGNPYKDFYLMEDVFREEEFLLYSPGVTGYLESDVAMLWMNLTAFNGSCWQTFGPLNPYRSFDPDDIFFFATEVNPGIEDEDDLISNVEYNPVPYMMLLSGANYPVIITRDDIMVHNLAEYDVDKINTKSLTVSFISEYNKGIYRLALKRWKDHPHFATAWYDEEKMTITLTSMTDRGFGALVRGLNKYGYEFSPDPFIRVKPSMLQTSSDILKRNINLTGYEELFRKESSPAEKKTLNLLNEVLTMAMTDINAGRKPDPESYAKKTGVNPQTARDIVAKALESIGRTNKRYGK